MVDQAYKNKKQGRDNHKPSQQNRGWHPTLIQNVLDHPVEKRPHKRDMRRIERGANNERIDQGSATDYVAPDGHYITVNDQTGEIIGVSDRFNLDWIDAFHEGRLTIPKMDPKLEKYWRNYNGKTNVAE